MHPIIKSVLGIGKFTTEKPVPTAQHFASKGCRDHVNYKRFMAVCDLLHLQTREFNHGYQLRCANKEKRLDYYPTTGKASWTGSNKFFDIDEIENFLFINFKN